MPITTLLKRNQHQFHPVIPFNQATDKLSAIDLSESGIVFPDGLVADTKAFSLFMEKLREEQKALYLVGGYGELRPFYQRSVLFGDEKGEPRRLHLGTDIWGKAGTPVTAFLGGMIHSLAYNEGFGNYGATLILLHQLEGIPFYTLYGHISKADLVRFSPGQYVSRGQEIASFGLSAENGQWPPHLHLQVIADLEQYDGDYPGVCRWSERDRWLANCPDPELILQWSNNIKYV